MSQQPRQTKAEREAYAELARAASRLRRIIQRQKRRKKEASHAR
jgi:hypothetical protein